MDRDTAVSLVDSRYGYTLEGSSSPEAHAAEYDAVELLSEFEEKTYRWLVDDTRVERVGPWTRSWVSGRTPAESSALRRLADRGLNGP